MITRFGVIHGDLFYHDTFNGKTPNPFVCVGRVCNRKDNCQRSIVVKIRQSGGRKS